VNDQKFPMPGADPTSAVIAVDTVPREIDPVPFGSDQLYAVQNGRVFLVTTPTGTPGLQELDVRLGRGRFAVESLAVSVNGTDLAVVTDGGKMLRRATTTARTSATLTRDLTDLLRPQFSRYGEVWAIGRQGGRQRFWLSSPDLPDTVASPVFGKGEITAFRVSPDGARIALVRRAASGAYELGLARIIRNGTVKVDGWKPIEVRMDARQQDAPALARIFDVAWLDANELLVLGASGPEAAPVTIRVATDASRVTGEGAEDGWTPRALTVLTRPQTAIAVGWDGRTWRKNGGQWVPFLSDVTTLAYAG
jgi:dipeptidyl aminopeptidase/acylaminoacyl peptidase